MSKSSPAWNHWYHVTVHVYGSWLRGDPRGWRARHHREHVDGDYKNPPPEGKYDELFKLSKSLMKRDPVKIAEELRQFVVDAIAEKLERDVIQILVASVDAKHLHVLAKFPDDNPRHWIGRAKKHTSHRLRQEGLRTDEGGLWAKRSYVKPIADRQHQVEVFRYILGHLLKGARIWRYDARKREDRSRP